jgi:RNA polymerase sigma-70 factor (ECF subfamily)
MQSVTLAVGSAAIESLGPTTPDDPTASGIAAVRASDEPGPDAQTQDLAQQGDTALVGMVGTGSVAAFAVLVERHSVALYRVGLRMLGDAHEAEDVVQDAFARLWQYAARWKPSGAGLIGWLHRVAINLCFDRKRRFRVITTADLPDIADDAPLADRLIEADQARAAVAGALNALPERHRAALVLCYFESYSNAAAADMLSLSIKAMESLLFRARRQLREVLERRDLAWRELVHAGQVERSPAA